MNEGRAARIGLAALALGAFACARIESPPGGPPDTAPPQLVTVHPDSLAILRDFKGSVDFQFNEVISEGGSPNEGLGTGDLERLIILSPTNRVPDVNWKRRRLTVRPAEGWRPNTVYRIELLPGVVDLRSNRLTAGRVITFTTGAPAPTDTLHGMVYDWNSSQPARAAVVEAILQPDSLPYRTLTDSSGAYKIGPLPKGNYTVYAYLDQNRNLRRELREQFDSVKMLPDSHAVAELWTFPHDTTPPRMTTATPNDSVSVTLTFNQKLDPYQRLDTAAVRFVVVPDSTPLPVRSILLPYVDDSLNRPSAGPLGEVTGAMPRAPGKPAAKPLRPALVDRLVLRVVEPLKPGGRYAVFVKGVRSVTGLLGEGHAALIVPERPKVTVDSSQATPARRLMQLPPLLDSIYKARVPADSTAKRDTTRAKPSPK